MKHLSHAKKHADFAKIDTYGSVRNADRIWARAPQNHTYRGLGEKCGYKLLEMVLAQFQTPPATEARLWTELSTYFWI